MKVLVTGATGFIGSYLIPILLEQGSQVIATSVNPEKARNSSWYSQVKYIQFNLADFDESTNYFDFFEKPDILIHLAWEGLPNYKSEFHETINLPQNTAWLTNLIKYGLTDLTVTGTCLEYGMQEGRLHEDMQAYPDNSYARAKNLLRIEIENLKTEYSFSFKWVRLFYMYGKGQNPNSLLSQLEGALQRGDQGFDMSAGGQVRDYLPVEKVADNLVSIAFQKQYEGVINNCSGIPITINELVSSYLKKNNKHIKLNLGVYPYPDYEPMRFWGDADKLIKILNNE